MYSKRIRRVMGIFWFMMCATDVWIAQLQSHTFWETSVWIKPDTLHSHIYVAFIIISKRMYMCVLWNIIFCHAKVSLSLCPVWDIYFWGFFFFFLFIKFNLKFSCDFHYMLRIFMPFKCLKNMVIKSILVISYLIRRLHTKEL